MHPKVNPVSNITYCTLCKKLNKLHEPLRVIKKLIQQQKTFKKTSLNIK